MNQSKWYVYFIDTRPPMAHFGATRASSGYDSLEAAERHAAALRVISRRWDPDSHIKYEVREMTS